MLKIKQIQGLQSVLDNISYTELTTIISGTSSFYLSYDIISTNTTYTITSTSGMTIIKCDSTIGAYTINLPTAIGNSSKLIFKKISGTYPIIIKTYSDEVIDGAPTAVISRLYDSITLISDNENWWYI